MSSLRIWMSVIRCVCSFMWLIISRDRSSHSRTSPLVPPESRNRMLWLSFRAVTPPACALSTYQRLSPVSMS
jgi:hypothetical protein